MVDNNIPKIKLIIKCQYCGFDNEFISENLDCLKRIQAPLVICLKCEKQLFA